MARPTAHQRLYGHRWRLRSKHFLRNNPLCVMCQARGRIVQAQCVDHVTPHRGDLVLFWDEVNNWQALCFACHNSRKQRIENRGYSNDFDPATCRYTDSNHPSNRK
jgi:5-methylcytosine-specific restriction protein A